MRDFVQGKAQLLGAPDEEEGLQIAFVVAAITGAGARRRLQDSLAFVEADGLDIDGGSGGEFSDFHGSIVNPIVRYSPGAKRAAGAGGEPMHGARL